MKRIFALLVLVISFLAGYAQKESSEDYDDGINKKWELKVDVMGSMASRGDPVVGDGLTEYDEAMGADLGIGYNFTSNWYAGLSSGFWYHWGGESNNMIPLLGDAVWRWNLGTKEKYSLFLEGRAGYLFGLKSDREYFKQLRDYQFSDHVYFDIQPGLYVRTRLNIDFRVSISYGYTKPIHNYEAKYFANLTEEELEQLNREYFYAQPEHIFSLKLGFNFRGKSATPRKEEVVLDDIQYYEQEVAIVRREAELAERRAERAARRLAQNDAEFEKQVEKTQQRESDMVLYVIIPNIDEVADYQPDLLELAEWAKTHKKGRIILKSYIRNSSKALSYASEARKRMKYVKDILVKEYGIKSRMIKTDIYVVSAKTARENDISKRVDIYTKEKK